MLGLVSIPRLGIDLFPRVEFPMVVVPPSSRARRPRRSNAKSREVLEESINTIEGIRSAVEPVERVALDGWVEFELEYEIREKAQEVRDRVAAVRGELPRDSGPSVVDLVDPDSAPILVVMLAGFCRP